MTIKPSIFDYDRRDPLEYINYQERVRCTAKFALWLVIIALGLTLVHMTVFGAQKPSEAVVEDESVLCANPISSPDEVDEYCLSLKNRSL